MKLYAIIMLKLFYSVFTLKVSKAPAVDVRISFVIEAIQLP